MIGDNLRKIMADKKITAKELAARVEVSPTHLSYIANNKRNPSFELLDKIADELGVLLTDLVQVTSDVPETPTNEHGETKKPKDLKKILEQEDFTLNGRIATQEDRERLVKIFEAMYWDAKQQNKRK